VNVGLEPSQRLPPARYLVTCCCRNCGWVGCAVASIITRLLMRERDAGLSPSCFRRSRSAARRMGEGRGVRAVIERPHKIIEAVVGGGWGTRLIEASSKHRCICPVAAHRALAGMRLSQQATPQAPGHHGAAAEQTPAKYNKDRECEYRERATTCGSSDAGAALA